MYNVHRKLGQNAIRVLIPKLQSQQASIRTTMDSQATPQTKSFIGRGLNFIPKAPTNPDDRTMIHIRPFPHNNDFSDPKIVKCISQL
ncbi:hypothetical protein DCAR_0205435 [Daucus carota subsp. sativus]|uniref:Uncharacterized protein n=1 Tax=Daucus carota subsp. sativus TaxID=79200 RepID=A0A161WZC0_DAUCS|nr:hypothetical protein DCAR_0205435 [Daucus carota subsp. sativus]